jgi:Flp pilus assembly protein TadD/mono/diheme cytochrome c family protein
MFRVVLWFSCVLALGVGGGCAAPDADSSRSPTFAREIAPIVYERCATCHRPGEAGPFSLLTYDDVRKRARQISEVVTRRYMPPWMPEPGHGEFADDRRLTDAQIALIRQWVDAGAAEGDVRDLPPPPTWPQGWQLGEPDLVVSVSTPFRMPAGGADQFRTFIVPVSLTQARHVRAVEFRPGNARAVHHAVVRVAHGPAATKGEQILGETSDVGMLVSEESIASPDGHLIGWAPGYSPNVAPADMPWRIEPGQALALEVHLQTTGKPEDVQPSVGLFFTDRAATRRPYGLQLGSYTIDIPPGAGDYVIEDRYTLPVDVEVMAIYPHAHYLGKDIRAWAILPDGSERSLIWIKNWDFNWQNAYRYAAPVTLARGTTIAMRYVYDNSASNPRNPRQPPQRVRYGGQSSDEMGNLWLQVVPRDESALAVLRADYTLKSTQRQIAGYEHLLQQSPGDTRIRRALADAHNFIGATLRQQGNGAAAIREFARAIEIWSSHAPARNNLASIFRAQGRVHDATREYARALEIDPDYVDAHYNFGLLLQATGKPAEAARHFRRAIAIEPLAPQAYNALAWLLATDPRSTPALRTEAVALAERAVQLTSERDASALDTLAAAYAANGDFDRALAAATQALNTASRSGQTELAGEIQQRLAIYGQKARRPSK